MLVPRRRMNRRRQWQTSSPPAHTANIIDKSVIDDNKDRPNKDNVYPEDFSVHMSKYIGKTVTIFVRSGGLAGMGFTGLLINSNKAYVRLITQIGPAPSCTLGNSCFVHNTLWQGNGFYSALSYNPLRNIGSVADIPIDKVVSFVHNTI